METHRAFAAPPLLFAAAMVLEHESLRDLIAAVTQREVPTLIERAGGLARLAHAEPFEIAAHLDERDLDTRPRGEPVESPSRATLEAARALAAAFELGRRVEANRNRLFSLAHSDAIEHWATPRLVSLPYEEAWVLAVDRAMNLRGARCIARGPHWVALRAADPVRAAIRLDASAFFLVHNHPCGDPTPSREDIETTQRIAAASMIADIPLLEHIVVARRGSARIPVRIRDADDTDQ